MPWLAVGSACVVHSPGGYVAEPAFALVTFFPHFCDPTRIPTSRLQLYQLYLKACIFLLLHPPTSPGSHPGGKTRPAPRSP
ncbi:uncharacterized protein L3040_001867 [Drepanopeziza brunnea f. sp. 'multigermtubi']|uniref:uncharacterized protein n=1 Tax=Drepanopeziza brunnea f. sp. 'multigermtubi' TaxID=698441 RepID=UPI0023A513A9|nr:hypothetical protein L3040_001867 [Drepanopeziza brunnea f. sp. 'multigermtubi']